jgi:exodeoxyribonuclease VIII
MDFLGLKVYSSDYFDCGEISTGLFDISDDVYFDNAALSRSSLWNYKKSPAHYLEQKNNPRKQTEAMMLGKALHMAVLQPNLFADYYVCKPAINTRTKIGAAQYAEWVQNNLGKTPVDDEDLAKIIIMSKLLKNHPKLQPSLENSLTEIAALWIDKKTNIRCKCKFDMISKMPSGYALMDIKTCLDVSDVAYSIGEYGYNLQAAMYSEGFKQATGLECKFFLFVFIEKNPPFNIRIIHADDEIIRTGNLWYEKLLSTHVECLKHKSWQIESEVETVQMSKKHVLEAENYIPVKF